MRVVDLMTREVRSVAPEQPISDAVREMSELHVAALPVVDGRGRLLGVVSTTDVMQTDAEGLWSEEEGEPAVRDVMSQPALSVPPDAAVRDAAQQMLYADVHRLFVVEQHRLVGVIAQSDIVRAVAHGLVAV